MSLPEGYKPTNTIEVIVGAGAPIVVDNKNCNHCIDYDAGYECCYCGE